MKTFTFIVSTLLASVLAAPAVVWKSSRPSNERFLHSSDDVSASDLLKGVLQDSEAPQASLPAVVFLVGKGEDGSEQLTELASTGKLPQTSEKYNDASAVYHHVSGIASSASMVREAARANNGHRVLQISLGELNSKLTSLSAPAEVEIDNSGAVHSTSKRANKRARELATANVFIVNVDSTRDATEIDTTIANTIGNKSVGSVILAGVRSVDEVKHERNLEAKRRMSIMEKEGNKILDARRRRLEQEEQGGDAAQNAYDDLAGVYYVAMTPNILAGLLFGFLFIFITYVGITCMGAIQGGDTFTDKMPSIGREA
jgi:hypothetical protein